MEPQKIAFILERETPNMVRYTEVEELGTPVIGTLYVSKEFLGDTPPRKLTVTVTEADE